MAEEEQTVTEKRHLDEELNLFERKIEDLRVLYEQYFIDILPQPPDQQQREVKLLMRQLLKAPFKNAQSRFRLKMLVSRYQTFFTYWQRVLREREEGRYHRDVFKAQTREATLRAQQVRSSQSGKAEHGLRELFTSYQDAVKKVGGKGEEMNFDAFRNSLVKSAKKLREEQGVKKVHYKIIVKDGKVVIKATAKTN